MRYISSKATVAAEVFFTDQFREYLISLGDDHDPDDAVFPDYINSSGEQQLSTALVELMEEAGIDRQPYVRELKKGQKDVRTKGRTRYKKRPYSTRHTISGRISDKFGLDVSQKILNQRDMRSTFRYAKPQRSTMKKVAVHLSGKVVGSVGMFKQEQEKQAGRDKNIALGKARRARRLEEEAREVEKDPVYKANQKLVLASLAAGMNSLPTMPESVKVIPNKKTRARKRIPVPKD